MSRPNRGVVIELASMVEPEEHLESSGVCVGTS